MGIIIKPQKKTNKNIYLFALVGIMVVACFLRLYKLGDECYWVDEIGHIQAANSQNITSLLSNVRIHAGAAPLDYLILYLVNPLIEGYLNSSYRLIYAFYGILAVFATYVLGKMIKGAEVGLLSAFLLAISPFHIKYSQEVRFYSLSLLISVVSFICLITALKRKSRRSWIILGVVNILGLYTFYYFVFIILFELLFVFLSLSDDIGPSRVREIFRCFEMRWAFLVTVLVILAFVPWILWDDSTSSLILTFPFHIHPINALFAFGMQIGGIFVFTLFLLVILPNVFQKYSLTFLLITVGSVLGAVLVDNLFNYFFSPRQVLFVLPFLFCAVSISIKDFLGKILKSKRVIRNSITLAVVTILPVLFYIYPNMSSLQAYYKYYQKPTWYDVVDYINHNDPNSNIAVFTEMEMKSLNFYLDRSSSNNDSEIMLIRSEKDYEQILNSGESNIVISNFWLGYIPFRSSLYSGDIESISVLIGNVNVIPVNRIK